MNVYNLINFNYNPYGANNLGTVTINNVCQIHIPILGATPLNNPE